jgi:hypothetical protein
VDHDAHTGAARFRSKPVCAVQWREAVSCAIEAVHRPQSRVASPQHSQRASAYAGELVAWHPSACNARRFFSLVLVWRSGGPAAGTAAAPPRLRASHESTGSVGSGSSTAAEGKAAASHHWLVMQQWEVDSTATAGTSASGTSASLSSSTSPSSRRAVGLGSVLLMQAPLCVSSSSLASPPPSQTHAHTHGGGAAATSRRQQQHDRAGDATPAPSHGAAAWVCVAFVSPEAAPTLTPRQLAAAFTGRCPVALSPTAVTLHPRQSPSTPVRPCVCVIPLLVCLPAFVVCLLACLLACF